MTQQHRIRPGLCSVTFRALTPERIISLVEEAGLKAIEWGMDGHLPPGDLKLARALSQQCGDAGIATPTVGSYLRSNKAEDPAFAAVLESAQALGAKTIRIWAGQLPSDKATPRERAKTVETIRSRCDAAQASGLRLSLEYHSNTLTDTLDSTLRLLDEVDHPCLTTYWQPRGAIPSATAVSELAALGLFLGDIHVFYWTNFQNRFALQAGEEMWTAVFDHLIAQPRRDKEDCRNAFLEFVLNDDVEQFKRDARTLRQLLSNTP
ncbi:MAG: sugar phosphate isomerase/epimerase family protein [Marinosulfonomonas sp.]